MSGLMQKQLNKRGLIRTALGPFFPATINPSRRADFCIQQNTASCVLSISKRFPMLKTNLPLQGAENVLRSRRFCMNLKMD